VPSAWQTVDMEAVRARARARGGNGRGGREVQTVSASKRLALADEMVDMSGDVPEVGDVPGMFALPEWVSELRPHQWHAAREAVELFRSGKRVVWLDAPTGSGKTLIGELVRRLLDERALYVCSSLQLQDQFVADFDYARVLKGRGNYPTQLASFPSVTAADCTKTPGPLAEAVCDWCMTPSECKYQKAREKALGGALSIVNTSYLLHEANYAGGFSNNMGLTVVDECDVLEGELMNFVQFELKPRLLKQLQVDPPKQGSHMTTIVKWLGDEVEPALKDALVRAKGDRRASSIDRVRKVRMLESKVGDVRRVVDGGVEGGWVRDNKAGPMVLKPVSVKAWGEKLLWRHAKRWLCMSATIVSAEEMGESLGLERGDWGVVRVPMTFPVENRPVYLAPVADMTAKNKDVAWPEMAAAITRLVNMDKYRGVRVLVHTVSYELAEYLWREVELDAGRERVVYRDRDGKAEALRRYREVDGSVMYAPSMDRGVDFRGEDCRLCVVAKTPFPYLGDAQVSARKHAPGGNTWYAVQTVRTVVQMTGRGVRSSDDWCDTFMLDRQFAGNVWKRNRGLFPGWWREAVRTDFPVAKLRR
jgi:ATP-dependent DNA helicase DinG